LSEEKAAPPARREVKIKLVQHGEHEFTYTGEAADDIREAVTQAAATYDAGGDRDKLVRELIQVAAMAASWVEVLEGSAKP